MRALSPRRVEIAALAKLVADLQPSRRKASTCATRTALTLRGHRLGAELRS